MNENNQLTMKDIARLLGVSVATVSRALKDSPSISRDQREKIQQFARDHNYYPNQLAATLRKSKVRPQKVIGVIIPQFTHYYFASILTGIEEVASERSYRIIVATSAEKYEKEVAICESFFQIKVCGVIVSQAKDTVNYSHFKHLIDHGIPIVFYDRICAGINCSRVVVDDYQGSYKAVNYLIEHGCKRIAFFGSPLNMEISKNRYNGYKDALYHNGMSVDKSLAFICDNRSDAERITPYVLSKKDRPDGFFAVNDETAIGILHAAKRLGFSIPDQASICGFTNSNNAEVCDPMLTTVEQRGKDVGREAAGALIDQVEGIIPMDKVVRRIVKTRLVVRGTTR